MKINRVTLAIYLYTLLGVHMGMSRRNSVMSHMELCAIKAFCKGEFWVVIAYGQNSQ